MEFVKNSENSENSNSTSASEECSCSGESQSCGCIGYAYVPVQTFADTYDDDTALTEGSLFPELTLGIDEYGSVCKETGGAVNG